MEVLKVILARIWLAIFFACMLLVPGALWFLLPIELPDLLLGALVAGTSLVFWRGVRTFDAGDRFVEWAARVGLYGREPW